MLNNKVKIVIIIVVLLAGGVGGFFLNDYLTGEKGKGDETIFHFKDSVQTAAIVMGGDYQKFTHPDYGFSVEYPKELKIKAYQEDEDSQTIVFQKPGEKLGFQIFISPFEEGAVLTQERILEDLPTAVIDEPQEVVIGNGIHALLFWGYDPAIDKTREVWFSHNDQLYEITTYAHLDIWLAEILDTWSFNEL